MQSDSGALAGRRANGDAVHERLHDSKSQTGAFFVFAGCVKRFHGFWNIRNSAAGIPDSDGHPASFANLNGHTDFSKGIPVGVNDAIGNSLADGGPDIRQFLYGRRR